MYTNMNPLDEYVKSVKSNAAFIKRLISPQIGLPMLAIFLTIIGVLALAKF